MQQHKADPLLPCPAPGVFDLLPLSSTHWGIHRPILNCTSTVSSQSGLNAQELKQRVQQQKADALLNPPAPGAKAQQQEQTGFQLKNFMRDVACMGPDFYRMLLIIGLYSMGHINEVGAWFRGMCVWLRIVCMRLDSELGEFLPHAADRQTVQHVPCLQGGCQVQGVFWSQLPGSGA